jgi:hypothetical protein
VKADDEMLEELDIREMNGDVRYIYHEGDRVARIYRVKDTDTYSILVTVPDNQHDIV